METSTCTTNRCGNDAILFQWMDIDMYEGEPLEENPKIMADLPGSTNKPVPIVHLYGVTEVGNSVLAYTWFYHILYVPY